jgi:DNA repair protein RecO (recombination protein O)
MQTRTEGIVLKSMDYGEADLIVTYLTRDLGVKKAFAKSARKIKSRFCGSLEPLTHARIGLMGREDAPMPRLTQSDIIRPFQELREDYGCFVRLCSMVELTCGLLPEGAGNRQSFEFLLRMMDRMASGCSQLESLIYKVRLLRMKGYAPKLDKCTRCGAETEWFYPTLGAVACHGCAVVPNVVLPQDRKLRLPVSPGAVRLYEAILGWEIGKTARLKASHYMLEEIGAIVESHASHLLSNPLRVRDERVKAL